MASFLVNGIIKNIKFLPNDGGCTVTVHEFKRGYRKKNGEVVVDKWHEWKIIYRQGLVPYISEHFNKGMCVEIKGEIYPYAISDGHSVDGYSALGQTMNVASLPKPFYHAEQKMIKESQANSSGTPNLEAYREEDF